MKTLLNILIGIGVFLFIGTAGASDNGNISFSQIIIQILISIALITLGYYGLKIRRLRQKRIVIIRSYKKVKFSQVA